MDATIKLFSGGFINVLAPKVEDINIIDIAHALSCQGRFSGHTSGFYSVAQHSVLCSLHVHKTLALCALLHDATEAYLVDMPRPIKHATAMGDKYRELEDNLWLTIAKKFSLPTEMPQEVKSIDTQMLVTEMEQLMGGVYGKFTDNQTPLKIHIDPMPPLAAEKFFLNRFLELYRVFLTGDEWKLLALKVNDPGGYWREVSNAK